MKSLSHMLGSAVLGFAAAALPARADEGRLGMTLAQYERLAAQPHDLTRYNVLAWYLDGMVAGLTLAHASHRVRTQAPAFCLPDEAAFDVRDIQAAIRTELDTRGETWRLTPEMPVERVAVQGLKERYPCPAR